MLYPDSSPLTASPTPVAPDPSAAVMKAALLKIAAIEDKMFGGDWDEINEARQIARDALDLPAPVENAI